MIYLDNAATTGVKPPEVINAVNTALRSFSANAGRSGHTASLRAASAIYAARSTAAEFFGADGPENVIFTSNCTQAINMVIKGVLLREDRIIVSDLEHNAVMRPIYSSGITADVASVSLTNDDETIKSFERLIKPDTKMIFCTAASNVCGRRLPISELGRLCQSRGILFGVDAAQAAGVIPIDMKRDNIDYLCVAGHKGLYAPMAEGILIARSPITRTIIEGGTGTDSASAFQEPVIPEGFESGTANLPAIFGIRAGMGFVRRKGIESIARHEGGLIAYLYEELKRNKDIILYTPTPSEECYAPVLSFNVKGLSSAEAAQRLSRMGIAVRAGLHCAPSAHKKLNTLETGTLRACPSVFNTANDIENLLKAIKNIKKL